MEFILELEKDKTGKRRLPYLPDLEQLYDAEVAGADAGFARLMRALKKAGRYDDALIVLISDHGEEFNEHGSLQHAENLHHETVDIPLIVKLPRVAIDRPDTRSSPSRSTCCRRSSPRWEWIRRPGSSVATSCPAAARTRHRARSRWRT